MIIWTCSLNGDDKTYTYTILVQKLLGKWPLGKPRREDNIKMDL
jgi:hypothetical protein